MDWLENKKFQMNMLGLAVVNFYEDDSNNRLGAGNK